MKYNLKNIIVMEIVNIEKDAYEKFAGQFDHFVKKMIEMGKRGSDKRLGEWMDNQEITTVPC